MTNNNIQHHISQVGGFRATGVNAGIKKNNNLDLTLITSDTPCVAAGVFTKNLVKAAPLLLDAEHLQANPDGIRAVVINAGNANAGTGPQGMADARDTAAHLAERMNCDATDILVMSTGVIGQPLPMDAIKRGIDLALDAPNSDWGLAARGIMTTDTRPKAASITVQTDQGDYTIAGISKGSGMIAPNMATMLATVVTDARLSVEQARDTLQKANATSFNQIVVDGDMSTNDTVLLLASGSSEVSLNTPTDLDQFNEALSAICTHLAQEIVRDGEGATKFITLRVTGTADDAAAAQIANTVARSPLVKTAFYGKDANWGRMLVAVGYAGVPVDPEQISIYFQPGQIADNNGFALLTKGVPHNDEATASKIMQAKEIAVLIDCGDGPGEATVWTCDLSHDYISINADYRT